MKAEDYYLDPKYFETIVRATGLIPSSDRISRIKSIAEYNILLACSCKKTSIKEEPSLTKFLVKKCKDEIRFYKKLNKSYAGLLSLVVIEEYVEASKIIMRMNLHSQIQARVLRKVIKYLGTDEVFIILRMILERSKKNFLPKYIITLLLRKNEYRIPQDIKLISEIGDFLFSSSDSEYFNLAFKWMEKFQYSEYSKEDVIQRMLKNTKTYDFSKIDYILDIIRENNLEKQLKKEIEKASKYLFGSLKVKKYSNARGYLWYLIHKHSLINPYIKIGGIYACQVLRVIKSRVFVKLLDHHTRSASIYVGEVSEDKINDLKSLFKKGQLINAKVLSYDLDKGVNLSIKKL